MVSTAETSPEARQGAVLPATASRPAMRLLAEGCLSGTILVDAPSTAAGADASRDSRICSSADVRMILPFSFSSLQRAIRIDRKAQLAPPYGLDGASRLDLRRGRRRFLAGRRGRRLGGHVGALRAARCDRHG